MRHNFSLADQHATTQTRPSGLPPVRRAIIPDGQTMRVSFAMMDAMQHDFSKGTAMKDISLMDAETMILDAAPAADRAQLVTLLAQAKSGNRAIAESAIDNLNGMVRSYAGRAFRAVDKDEKAAWELAVDRLSGTIAGLQAKDTPPMTARDTAHAGDKPMTDAAVAHAAMSDRLSNAWR